MPYSNATMLERVQIALDIISGRNTLPSLPDLDTLGYDAYSMKKVPSLEELKRRSEELICTIVKDEYKPSV